jgi:hypothetical protein
MHLIVRDCGSHYDNVPEPVSLSTGSKRSGERALGRAASESRLPWPVDVRAGRRALLATVGPDCPPLC